MGIMVLIDVETTVTFYCVSESLGEFAKNTDT